MVRFYAALLLTTGGLLFSTQAGDKDHWSFQPITKPVLPDTLESSHPIDALVRARLAEQGMSPSPEANPHTLFRRLHLDLTGLVPTVDEMRAFEHSWKEDSEEAYTKAVDGLLASPHFGEQWGRHWLDLARYGDSDGYLGDSLRPWAWLYRDWVIAAINRDQPFDQFSIEQLAGDLLPDPTQDQKIAVGFHRNSLKNTEAGADRELDRTKRVVDRVATTGTIWLGLTLACAECHDHKHDPISQKEFYELYAFFNNLEDTDIAVRLEPEWEAYEEKRKEWEKTLTVLEKSLSEVERSSDLTGQEESSWANIRPDKVEAAVTELKIEDGGSVLASGKIQPTLTYFVEAPLEKETLVTSFRLTVHGEFGEGREAGAPAGRGKEGAFTLSTFSVASIVDAKSTNLKLARAEASHSDSAELAPVLSSSPEGWRVTSNTYQAHHIRFDLEAPVRLPAGSRLRFSLRQKEGTDNLMRRFTIGTTTASPPPPLPSTSEQSEWDRRRLAIEKHLAIPPAKPATRAQSLTETGQDKRRETHVHERGDYTRLGERVLPDVPAILPALSEDKDGDRSRLDLAQWLFQPEHPLTARVAVNRIWQHLFGVGLVATSDDLGTYGDRPTHPELLDWLALEFQRNGWSRKQLIRTILLSETYRQSSRNTNPDLSNQSLWRQNSFRLPAESVRDIHLVASGLFEPKVGGPSIHPPLPEFVTAVGRSVKWPESTGPDRYRRGLYIFLKRTVLYPMLTAFDAPDTSVACSRRERTNTPMQALTLLNDPVFFECSEALGRSLHREHAGDLEAALDSLVRRTLNRPPSTKEIDILRSAHHDLLRESGSEELAMIATARIVTNLDEFITRD